MASTEQSESTPESTSTESTDLHISRKEEADRIISKYTGWAAGSGAIPFPFWDVVAMAAIETKMVKELLNLYGAPFSESKVRSVVTVLIGSLSPQLLTGITTTTLLKFVPGGHVLAAFSLPLLGAASAYAVGQVIASHLENGGDLNNFDANAEKGNLKQRFEEGKEKLKGSAAKPSPSPAS